MTVRPDDAPEKITRLGGQPGRKLAGNSGQTKQQVTASIEVYRTLPETLEADPLAAAVDALATCYLSRLDRQPSELADGLRILTSTPPELFQSAIAYCIDRGWLPAPDDDAIERIVRSHVK